LKVALIDPIAHHGGLHYYTDQLARGLLDSEVELVVYGLAGDSFCTRQNAYPYLSVFQQIYGSGPAVVRGVRFLLGLLKIFVDVIRRKVDLVHINIFQYSVRELLQVILARLAGRKIVLEIHDVEAFGANTSEFRRKMIMGAASGLSIHNKFSLSCIPEHYLEGKEVALIPLVCQVAFVDDSISSEQARKRLQLPYDRTILLYFGNPRHEKGLDVAMKAMTFLRDMPELLLVTGGRIRKQQEMEFRAYIQANGLDDVIRMDVGTVPDDLAFDYYIASDLVLLPYRKVYESGVAIMAASCSRPILASDLPVFVDFIEAGKAGSLFRNEDADHMAQVIRSTVQSKETLRAMGEYAKKNIAEQRSAALVGRSTAALYRRVLKIPALRFDDGQDNRP
jgi:D-inositol-3-phosphate glycosyltransferase